MIIGKSSHPVTVKRIEIKVWKLRDEIEAAIALRMEAAGEGQDIKIDDLKAFYSQHSETKTKDEKEILEEDKEDKEDKSDAQKMADEIIDSDPETTLETSSFERTPPAQAKISSGFALLADINMDDILIFTKEPFIFGASIVLEFQIPTKFIVSAEVIKCVNIVRNSKIISENKPHYRIHARFTYPYLSERENLRNFLKSIEPEIPPSPKKIKKPVEEEDDDFEDLGL